MGMHGDTALWHDLLVNAVPGSVRRLTFTPLTGGSYPAADFSISVNSST